MRTKLLFALLIVCSLVSGTLGLKLMTGIMNGRRSFIQRVTTVLTVVAASVPQVALALSLPQNIASSSVKSTADGTTSPLLQQMVAYKTLSISGDLGVRVPVACWFPVDGAALDALDRSSIVSYQHRISVRKIGQLLVGWDFIPEFVARDFSLSPTLSSAVVRGEGLSLPSRAPVVILAHGYLGSRFDLSHLAEQLASLGFVCLAAEYPESLSASFDAIKGVDRARITNTLLQTLQNEWNVQATSFGIVGHSLGCGTALETGDDSWSRVLLAGFPRLRDGRPIPGSNVLLLASMNDGAVSLSRWGGKDAIPSSDFVLLDPDASGYGRLPRRAALVLEGENAPNHISFLSEAVNDAMIDLLSPMLPVAQTLGIPVLDFDRYQISRDSLSTARVVHPVVTDYLIQQMLQ